MIKTYISGQITGLDIKVAEDNFKEAEKHIAFEGKLPFNPMTLVPFQENKTWEQYMLEDIDILFGCDEIFMLQGWENSRGARIEHFIAKETGKKIIYQALQNNQTND